MFYSDYDFTSIDGFRYSKGYNKVNGEEALSFARERKAFAAGDNQRVKDQQALLEAIQVSFVSVLIFFLLLWKMHPQMPQVFLHF